MRAASPDCLPARASRAGFVDSAEQYAHRKVSPFRGELTSEPEDIAVGARHAAFDATVDQAPVLERVGPVLGSEPSPLFSGPHGREHWDSGDGLEQRTSSYDRVP